MCFHWCSACGMLQREVIEQNRSNKMLFILFHPLPLLLPLHQWVFLISSVYLVLGCCCCCRRRPLLPRYCSLAGLDDDFSHTLLLLRLTPPPLSCSLLPTISLTHTSSHLSWVNERTSHLLSLSDCVTDTLFCVLFLPSESLRPPKSCSMPPPLLFLHCCPLFLKKKEAFISVYLLSNLSCLLWLPPLPPTSHFYSPIFVFSSFSFLIFPSL